MANRNDTKKKKGLDLMWTFSPSHNLKKKGFDQSKSISFPSDKNRRKYNHINFLMLGLKLNKKYFAVTIALTL